MIYLTTRLCLIFSYFGFCLSNEICLSLPDAHQGQNPTSLNQGPPGRRGPLGPPGPKGDFGPPGRCACDPSEIDQLREEMRSITEALNLVKSIDREKLCSVGVKDGRVADEDITASDFAHTGTESYRGRLDNKLGSGTGAWSSGYDRRPGVQWIQVDLKHTTFVTGIITQGRPSNAQWITGFKIAYGNDTSHMQVIQRDDQDITFQGNSDSDTKVTTMFPAPIVARYVRLISESYYSHPSVRLEYITC